MFSLNVVDNEDIIEERTVIRLKTSYWNDAKGMHVRKDITYLKKKSIGFNYISEDVSEAGAEDTILSILNLDSCQDGLYEVVINHISRDWEDGEISYMDYKLIPYTEEAS